MHALLLLLFSSCPATLAERDGFSVCYDTHKQRPLWTIHAITNAIPKKSLAQSSAFTNSGFDWGHLASAADLPRHLPH